MSKFSHSFMKFVWRQQQVQAVASIFFWTISLTGIFYPYFEDDIHSNLGLGVLTGMVFFFLFLMISILLFGIVYDKWLKLWRFQSIVAQMRNPYSLTKLNPSEIYEIVSYRIRALESFGRKAEADFWRNRVRTELREDKDALRIFKILCERYASESPEVLLKSNDIKL